MNPIRTELLSRNLVADLLTWTAVKPTTITVFICGNPGLIDWYPPFLAPLHSSTNQVYALGHLGHSVRDNGVKEHVSLLEQAKHKIEFIDSLAKEFDPGIKKPVKLVLIGHSIGAWFCLEILKNRPELVSRAIFLFPAISDIYLTPNGRFLTKVMKYSTYLFPPIHILSKSLGLLPTTVLNRLVAILGSQPLAGAVVTSKLLALPHLNRNTLKMGGEEMEIVRALDEATIRQYGARMRFYWAKKDGWVLQSSVERICEILSEAGFEEKWRVICNDGMKHAFVMELEKTLLLAERCKNWIEEEF